jgi:translocation and assembly module TamB
LTAKANLSWGESARLDGQARFTAIDVGELLSHYTESRVVAGLATGRVDFGGQNMRSAKDISARVDAKLTQAVPSQMPVFRQVMPFIVPGVGANVQFDSGDLRAVLGGGVFRIEQLSLVGELARVFAEGSVTVDHQRLNLEVVANTKQLGMEPAVLQTLGLSLPLVGPIPMSVLNQATGYLSNRTIRLRVTGTIKAPAVQVNVAALLSETAVRFFIAQAGVPIPSAALQAPGP